jgi:hypothetical protein
MILFRNALIIVLWLLASNVLAQIKQIPLSDALEQLSKSRGVFFTIDEKSGRRLVKPIDQTTGKVEDLLNKLLEDSNLSFKKIGANTYTIISKENTPSKNSQEAAIIPSKYTLSGYVREQGSGELLPGVSVYLPDLKVGASTNNYGFFSLTVPANSELRVMFSFVGYKTESQTIDLSRNTTKDIALTIQSTELTEVIVHKIDEQVLLSESAQMSVVNTPMAQMQAVPALMGERDMLKVLQLMPGVHRGSEGSSGIYVRGGGADQNLIILDDAPVYNVFHLFGFFSLFNGDALKSTELTKGGFPARFGGRLSSVIELQMKEGNKETFRGDVSLGLVAAKATLEGPIVKGKSSFLVSARRTFFDLLTTPNFRDGQAKFYFYDLNTKMNFELGTKDRLYLSGYFGKDDGSVGNIKSSSNALPQDGGLFWRNATATLRWNHLFSEKIFLNTSLIFSDYRYKTYYTQPNAQGQVYQLSYSSAIEDIGFKTDMDWLPNPTHSLKMGAMLTQHKFTPSAIVEQNTNGSPNKEETETLNTTEAGIYVEDNLRLGQRLRANVGLRGSFFRTGTTNYLNAEPRGSLAYTLPKHWAVKMSYALMNQYIHLLSNSGDGLPTDLWVPATKRLTPQRSEQIAFGIVKDLPDKNLSFSVETYYKKMDGIIASKSSTNALWLDGPAGLANEKRKNPAWDSTATSGQGWAYGAEFFVQKKVGRLTGWVGYTLSWIEHQFDEINFGQKFYAKYDRRHDASVVGIYQLTPKITFSATWVYGTGNSFTVPTSTYTAIFPTLFDVSKGQTLNLQGIESRNNFRAEDYHRLDFNVQFYKKRKSSERFIDISIYNVYNRLNPFFYKTVSTTDSQGKISNVLQKVALFPIIPSVSYRIKF